MARNRLGITFIGIGFCLLAYLLGNLAASGLRRQIQPEPIPTVNGLFIDPKQLDLGEVWATPNHSFTLNVQNLAGSPRTITRFQTTCGCLQLLPENRTLQPGEKVEFAAQIQLLPGLPSERGVSHWPKTVQIDPVFKENLVPIPGWRLKGVVRNRIGIDTAQLSFADLCIHGGPAITRKVRAKNYLSGQTLTATIKPEWGKVKIENSGIADEFLVLVTPSPSLPIGPFRFDVPLSVQTTEEEKFPGPILEISGDMQPSSRVMPRVVFLGDHSISTVA